DAAPPVGESLSEAERRGLAAIEGLLAVGPGLARETALVLAIDRAIHVTGADCAALYLPAAGGELVAPVHRGFVPPPPRLPLGAGIVGRALGERDTIRGGPGDRARDPLLRGHGLEHALAMPVPREGPEVLGVLLVGRRRPAAFGPEALEVLALLADRLALVLGGPARSAAAEARLGEALDLAATAARVAHEAARRLGASRVAILLPEAGGLRVAAAIGVTAGGPPPDPDAEPLATARAT